MSKYSRLPYHKKKIGIQDGLRRIVVRDRAMVGMPKLIEVWVPENKFQSDPQGVVLRVRAAAACVVDAADTMEIEVMS